ELGTQDRLSLMANGVGIESLSASLHSSVWDLSRVQATNRLGLRGQVELNATITGPASALAGKMHLGGQGMEWSGRTLGELALDAEGRSGSWTLQGKLGELLTINAGLEQR